MPEDYQQEDWMALYEAALTELEHAKMTGRVEAARTAILARMEKLQILPGLHPEERQAIADALHGLKLLEQEEARFNTEAQRYAIDKTLERFRSVGPAIKRLSEDAEPE